jgi:hypothetical protein
MLESLMTEQRRRVVAVLGLLFFVTLLLWLARGPRPLWTNVPFLAISMLLTPLAYLGVYGFLYLNMKVNHISTRALRVACGFLFLGAAVFLAASAAFAIAHFVNHRPMPPANFLALGVALGSMRAWGLQEAATEPK